MQVHGDNVVAPGSLEHVGHELGGDGSTALVLLVLAGVGEVGDNGGDATGRGSLAGIDHDQQLHQTVVDVIGSSGLQNEDCTMRAENISNGNHFLSTQVRVPSSSRTLSPIVTLVSWLEYWRTMILVNSMPSLHDDY